MKKSRKIVAMLMGLSMSMAVSVPAFAAEPEVAVSKSASGETVYTQTVSMDELVAPYATSGSKTVTASSSLGLALDAGKSGTSTPVSFRFTTLPSNAKVRSIQIKPGSGVINNNNSNMLGAVMFTSITVTSPLGKTASLSWKASGMTDNTYFLNQQASGTWTAYVTGTNIAQLTGNPLWDLRAAGSLVYKSPQMTISYVLE